jgi:hypothetical protein
VAIAAQQQGAPIAEFVNVVLREIWAEDHDVWTYPTQPSV